MCLYTTLQQVCSREVLNRKLLLLPQFWTEENLRIVVYCFFSPQIMVRLVCCAHVGSNGAALPCRSPGLAAAPASGGLVVDMKQGRHEHVLVLQLHVLLLRLSPIPLTLVQLQCTPAQELVARLPVCLKCRLRITVPHLQIRWMHGHTYIHFQLLMSGKFLLKLNTKECND